MILREISLVPFGGLSGTNLEFQDGLNVIQGPNEAGKSTVFNAIQKVLFTPTNLTPSVFRREMDHFLPLGEGDTVTVGLRFDSRGDAYYLKRTWGATKSAELKFPNGSIITDEDAIKGRLISLLPAKEGTFNTVLMTYQSGLPRTLDDLEKEPESLQTLGAILRKTIFETDGVSVERFRGKIEAGYEIFFKRWNREGRCPESERRFKIGFGEILKAHYGREDVRAALQEAGQYEQDLDEINREITACSEAIGESETYIEANQKIVVDAQQRQSLNDRLNAINLRIEQYKKDNREWPVAEKKVEEIEASLPGVESEKETLVQEQEKARKKEEHQQQKDKFERASGRQAELQAAEAELEQAQELTEQDLNDLRTAQARVAELKAGVTAGKLSVRLKAKAGFSVSIQEGLDEAYVKEMVADEAFEYDQGNRIKIDHPDWEVEVTSGEGDFEHLVQEYEQAKQNLNNLLEQNGVESLEEAIKINKEYESWLQNVEFAQGNLNAELDGEEYEDLEASVAEIEGEGEVRDLEDVLEELHSVRTTIEDQKQDLEQYQARIGELEGTYESQDQLLLTLAGEAKRQQETENAIAQLAPLPEGVEDIEAFISEFEEKRASLDEEKQTRTELLIQRAELEKSEPEASAEELEKQLEEAEEQFGRVLRRGEAIGRIKDLADRLVDEMDSDTYRGLVEDLERYVILMTENRYARVEMEESLPKGFVRQDGMTLPYDLLSAGTKDVLALSLRLAMANHFLKDADGLLVLDDPLVDLDPGRQQKAADALREFASQKQVVLFTCHPIHAEMLGGNRIDL